VKSKPAVVLVILLLGAITYQTYRLLKQAKAVPSPTPLVASNQKITPRTSAPLDDLTRSRLAHEQFKASDLMKAWSEGGTFTPLSRAELDHFLKEKGRTPINLITASRLSHDVNLIREAIKEFPQEPSLQLELALRSNTPEEKSQAIQSFQRLAPDNSIGNYLAAQDAFSKGDLAAAGDALAQSLENPLLLNYNAQILQSSEDALSDAGYTPGMAPALALGLLGIPELTVFTAVSRDLKAVEDGFINQADYDSAEPAVVIGITLGQRIQDSSNTTMINQLVGISVEKTFLDQLDPLTVVGPNNATVAERLELIKNKQQTIKELIPVSNQLVEADDATLAQYFSVMKKEGEIAALQWLQNRK